jgi:hypothetical protein
MNKNNENSEKEQRKTRTGSEKSENFQFNTLQETREALAKITMQYINKEISEHTYRAFVYGVNGLCKLLMHEKLDKYDKRLAELEKARN